jgi:hypothetical protein
VSARACQINEVTLSAPSMTHDPFAAQSEVGIVSLSFTTIGPCVGQAALVDPSGAPLVQVQAGDLRLDFTASQSSLVSSTVPFTAPAGPSAVHLTWRIMPERSVITPPGAARAMLTAQINSDALSAPISKTTILEVVTPPRAQVNIAGASGRFGAQSISVVDFGVLQSGLSRRVFVQVRANTAATLVLSSRNGGVLRNETLPEAAPIDYRASLDGQLLPANLTAQFAVAPPRTMDGVSLPFDMTIGTVEGAMAGRYSDVITIDVFGR